MKGPVGFLNLGSTCYLNSLLQCIIYDKKLLSAVNETETTENSFINEFRALINLIHLGKSNNELNLLNFIKEFTKDKPFFEAFRQNDSHEFYIHLIDSLCSNNNKNNKKLSNVNSPELLWDDFLSVNNEQLAKIFHGQTLTSIRCSNCDNTKEIYEIFNCIILDLPQDDEKSSICRLFINYLNKEIQDDPANLYYCEHCKSNTISEKKPSIYRLPKKLILILKKYSSKGQHKIKLNKKLKIREPYSGNILKYSLTGVVFHHGTFNYGHYNCITNVNDIWYFIDDSFIEHVENPHEIINKDYILFYSTE